MQAHWIGHPDSFSREGGPSPSPAFLTQLAALAMSAPIWAAPLGGGPAIAAYGGDLNGNRHRVVVSTDVRGTDPDDTRPMVHLFVDADCVDIEAMFSSP